MHFGNDRLRPAVPVGIHWTDFFVPPQQHIVHAPGVNRQADDLRKLRLRRRNARFHMGEQRVHIPDKMSVLLLHAVRKAVDLFRFQRPVLPPAHNVPPGGCADVDGKITLHNPTPNKRTEARHT